MKTIGAKFEATKDMRIAEVAKLIRKDLKDQFPGLKFKVNSGVSTFHPYVDVTVCSLPAGVTVRNQAPHLAGALRAWMSDEAIALSNAVQAVVNAYNWDNSEPQSDYYNSRFFESVQFASELRGVA